MLTLPGIYTRIILVIGMEENYANNDKSNQEKQSNKESDNETGRKNPEDLGLENGEKSGEHKKIERCEPCLHCGSHCIYLNRE
jgi:hypothetical protein